MIENPNGIAKTNDKNDNCLQNVEDIVNKMQQEMEKKRR